MMLQSGWILAVFLAAWAGVMDWRYRRIPNWLTVPGLVAGIAVNTVASGWNGAKASLLGAGLGLLILLPFVLIRALGAGDWKLIGAIGACLGPSRSGGSADWIHAGCGRDGAGSDCLQGPPAAVARQHGKNAASIRDFDLPGAEVSLDNPDSVKIPFGVAVAFTVLLFGVRRAFGAV